MRGCIFTFPTRLHGAVRNSAPEQFTFTVTPTKLIPRAGVAQSIQWPDYG